MEKTCRTRWHQGLLRPGSAAHSVIISIAETTRANAKRAQILWSIRRLGNCLSDKGISLNLFREWLVHLRKWSGSHLWQAICRVQICL
jgi:hypothetical protein